MRPNCILQNKSTCHASLRAGIWRGAFFNTDKENFNISTEFYTEYSGFSTAFVENPVESVEKGVK